MSGSRFTKIGAQAQIIYKGVSDISKIAKGLLLLDSAVLGGDGTAAYTVPIGKTMANIEYQCVSQISFDPDLLGLYIKNIENKTITTFDVVLSGVMAGDKSIIVDFMVIGKEA